MENDKLFRKLISVLAISISPIVSFPFDAIEHCKERLSNIRSIYL